MDNHVEKTEQNNKRRSDLWRIIIALLFLLLSFACVLLSSNSALYFIDRDKIIGGIIPRMRADYGPGALIELAPIDRDRIIAEIASDELALAATPQLVEARAVAVALLPKITPIQFSTPTAAVPTPTPTATPTGKPGVTPPPASPTPKPIAATPTAGIKTPVASATPPPASPTVAGPTPTGTSAPPTATATTEPPTATSTSHPATATPTTANHAPAAGNDTVTVAEDDSVTFNPLANDSDSDGALVPGTLAITANPAHGTAVANPATGEITYTPAANYNGSDSLTYRICDNDGACATATVSITVTPVNDAPQAVDDEFSTPQDTPISLPVLSNDIDIDGPTLFVAAVGSTTAGTVANNSSSVYFTPSAGYVGLAVFTYTASDGSLTDTATVTVTVTPVNHAPVAMPDSVSNAEDTPEDIFVLANDSDVDGDPLTVIAVTTPANGTTSTDGISVRYTPNPNFDGVDTFYYTISDGSLTATAIVTVTQIPINDAPQANADTYSVASNTTLSVAAPGVLSNDTDVEGDTLQANLASGPTAGTLTLDADGGFTYTPPTSFTGAVTFTYNANDGTADSAPATVTINVN